MTRSDRAFRAYAEQTEAKYGSSPRKRKRRRRPAPDVKATPKPTPVQLETARRMLAPSKPPATDPGQEKLETMRRGFRG